MNERWNELIKQAIREIGPEDNPSKEETLKRYAELIVKECATIIDDIPTTPQGVWSDGYYEGCRDSAKAIQKHFGVE